MRAIIKFFDKVCEKGEEGPMDLLELVIMKTKKLDESSWAGREEDHGMFIAGVGLENWTTTTMYEAADCV